MTAHLSQSRGSPARPWAWHVTPTAAGRLVMPVFARMRRGYAQQALEEVESVLLR